MSERPILFSGPMVQAILSGAKTQTRRVVKPQPECDSSGMWRGAKHGGFFAESVFPRCFTEMHDCPFGKPGDRLWVRETWRMGESGDWEWEEGTHAIDYRADSRTLFQPFGDRYPHGDPDADPSEWLPRCHEHHEDQKRWRPSIHMPRWASRIDLLVKDVRVERLQDISEEDAIAEGAEERPAHGLMCDPKRGRLDHWQFRQGFRELWDSINTAKHPWSSNPYVWVVEFERVRP